MEKFGENSKKSVKVENMLFKSLLKMKKASDEGVIDYLIIICVKCD